MDPGARLGAVILESNGLGSVGFGDERGEVLAFFRELIGTPPLDPGAAADWVEYTCYERLGLCLGFSLQAWEQYDGESRFVGWHYRGGGGVDVRTATGVGVGTTSTELLAMHNDVELATGFDECSDGGATHAVVDGIVIFLSEDGVVTSMTAGLGVGC